MLITDRFSQLELAGLSWGGDPRWVLLLNGTGRKLALPRSAVGGLSAKFGLVGSNVEQRSKS